MAHAALLFDFSTLSPESTATTKVSPDALFTPPADPTATDTAPRKVSAVRWVASPPPPPTPPAPRPSLMAKPTPPAPAPAPAPAPIDVPEAAPTESSDTPEAAPTESSDTPEAAPTEPSDTLEAAQTEPSAQASSTTESDAPSPPIKPIPVPTAQTRLVYDITGEVKGRNVFAEGLFAWTVKDGRYDASLAVRMVLLGTRTQTSVGHIGPQGLMPDRFGERQRDEAATHFDYEGQRVRFSRNRPDAPLLPGTQDRLSVILQLAALMQARPSDFEVGSQVNMPVASSREVEDWRWQVGDLETLALPKGDMIARRLTRPALNERDNTLELWMAPSLQHLPARIRITQSNGDWLDQRLVLAP
ncbi:Protein of unknown function DUF3108 [Burkholderiaceae bacterium]